MMTTSGKLCLEEKERFKLISNSFSSTASLKIKNIEEINKIIYCFEMMTINGKML
jgi:hypothetical protein